MLEKLVIILFSDSYKTALSFPNDCLLIILALFPLKSEGGGGVNHV